jgi:ABC-2 type transport system permease protein
MKVLNIAFKDLRQQFRSSFAVGMMFVAPLLITGLLYMAFGGLGGGGEEAAYSLPMIQIQVVNLDQGDPTAGVNAGEMLVELLASDSLKDMLSVAEVGDPQAARSAVDRREAAVAVLVPENFTRALLVDPQPVKVTLYQDPTLTFGPGLVKEIVSSFVDGFAGTQMVRRVLEEQYQARGQDLSSSQILQAQMEYGSYLQSRAAQQIEVSGVNLRPPASRSAQAQDALSALMGPVMAGMLIFFVFFTAVNTAITILREQEEGTLARMFTTPTAIALILGGKFTSIVLLLVVQSTVLLAASAVLFKIQWGGMLQLVLVVIGLVVVASGAGILLISFAKNTRQAGPLTGGVLTLTSMAGGLFTAGMQNMPQAFDIAGMVMPQGWAMRGMKVVMSGGSLGEVLVPVLIMLAMGMVFFAVGANQFRNRFA